MMHKAVAKLVRLLQGQNGTDLGAIESNDVSTTRRMVEKLGVLLSSLETNRRRDDQREVNSVHELEYSVFSQFGDDGIIQYLTDLVPPTFHTFIEFGVDDYTESNTRLLLQRNNWRGLVIDSATENIEKIKQSPDFWRHDLTAKTSFVTCDNINPLFEQAGFHGKIGVLSIDIDGNDYWVWQAINCVNPLIVVVEYNSIFGPNHAVTVPYDPEFNRTKAHYSNLYAGASLPAMCQVGSAKGYRFIGSNSAGNNAYFVRKELAIPLPELSPQDGYVESKFRESRGREGELTFLSGSDRLREIAEMPVFDVLTSKTLTIKELFEINE